MADLLAGAEWSCAPASNGAGSIPARVPGTVAAALREAGQWAIDDGRDFDAEDWWFRTRVPTGVDLGDGPWLLQLDGIATIADVSFAGRHVLHSENMFRAHTVELDAVAPGDELVIACAALATRLAMKRPRPRWKTRLVTTQSLRWFRTTLLGRMPGWAAVAAPVGPWRPVRLVPAADVPLRDHRVRARVDGDRGVVEVSGRWVSRGGGVVGTDGTDGSEMTGAAGAGSNAATSATPRLRVGGVEVDGRIGADGALSVRATVDDVVRWWPHTHGEPRTYPVSLTVGDRTVDLGRVGFRTVDVDQTDDGFALLVNGERVFCRGACWVPPDPVSLHPSPDDVRATLARARDAGMNMVRVTGTNVYEDASFWDACDELGILVWQDAMFANMDPPDDAEFVADVTAELRDVLGCLQARPSLAVVCGGSEVEQQAAMLGLPPERWTMPLFDETLPAIVDELVPDVPYVTNSPTGGDLPFHVDAGVGHYYGVGAYRRPLDDARRAGVRFTTECLAFATPPEDGGYAAVPRDNGADWSFADVTDHYAEMLFGAASLDRARAAVAHAMAATMSEWRRGASSCNGALVFTLRDLWPGSGWGVLDAFGRPKAPWYALARVLAPVALLATDEGLNGLHLEIVNDRPAPFGGRLRVELFAPGGHLLEQAEADVAVGPRGHRVVTAEGMFAGFRDLTYAYRFGAPAHDVVAATLLDRQNGVVGRVVHLPLGLARDVEPDLGLRATAAPGDDGTWVLTIDTDRFAQAVAIDVPGYRPDDSWFDLPPGATARVVLRPVGPSTAPGSPAAPPRSAPVTIGGTVRALNGAVPVPIEVTT